VGEEFTLLTKQAWGDEDRRQLRQWEQSDSHSRSSLSLKVLILRAAYLQLKPFNFLLQFVLGVTYYCWSEIAPTLQITKWTKLWFMSAHASTLLLSALESLANTVILYSVSFFSWLHSQVNSFSNYNSTNMTVAPSLLLFILSCYSPHFKWPWLIEFLVQKLLQTWLWGLLFS